MYKYCNVCTVMYTYCTVTFIRRRESFSLHSVSNGLSAFGGGGQWRIECESVGGSAAIPKGSALM